MSLFQNLNEQIVQVKEDLAQKRKIHKQLEDYKTEQSDIQGTVNRLQDQLKEEQKDVKKLEGISLTNFFSTISGTKYEKLEKENKEVLAVQLQLEEAEHTRDEIQQSINDLQKELGNFKNTEQTYEELLQQKEQLIKETDSFYADELYKLSEQEGDSKAFIKEIKEAIYAGKNAQSALQQASESLNSASNWGTLDMLGGGLLTSAVKHSKMDDASGHIHLAQSSMRKFQKELLDINEMIEVDMNMSGLLKFADFFFDGLIVDWMVQGKINESRDQVQEQIYKVDDIMRKLKSELTNLENKLVEIEQKRTTLIERTF
jgi:DNA repair exonuclease SbcCD ATPase subunit